jgi:hypothetical protein
MKERLKKRKTYEVRFTRTELAHIRDLFGVVLPPDAKKTLSQHLAEVEDRVLIEERLWEKLADAMKLADVPLDEEAPDYIIAPLGSPPLGVFPLSRDDAEEQEET